MPNSVVYEVWARRKSQRRQRLISTYSESCWQFAIKEAAKLLLKKCVEATIREVAVTHEYPMKADNDES